MTEILLANHETVFCITYLNINFAEIELIIIILHIMLCINNK